MKLDLTPEQAFFHGTTRQFLDDKVPTSLLRELRDDAAGFGRDFWRQGADLGWTSLLVSEADGGGSVSGQGLVDLALVAFEFGRYAAPGPLTAANVMRGWADGIRESVLLARAFGMTKEQVYEPLFSPMINTGPEVYSIVSRAAGDVLAADDWRA